MTDLITQQYIVPADHELRIYTPLDESHESSIRLAGNKSAAGDCRGDADFFGAPMMEGEKYLLLPGEICVLHSWSDVTVEIDGSEQLHYGGCIEIAGNGMHARPLAEYDSRLRDARDRAMKASRGPSSAAGFNEDIDFDGIGPRVLIVGKPSSGKHAALRTLGNYAAWQGYRPTIVDFNPSTSQCVGLPGSIGACVQEFPLRPDDGAGYQSFCGTLLYTVGTTTAQYDQVVVKSPAVNSAATPISGLLADAFMTSQRSIPAAYKHYVRLLANKVNERLFKGVCGTISAYSGCIAVAPSVTGRDGLDLIKIIIETLQATHVLCIGDGHLHSQLQRAFPSKAFMDSSSHIPREDGDESDVAGAAAQEFHKRFMASFDAGLPRNTPEAGAVVEMFRPRHCFLSAKNMRRNEVSAYSAMTVDTFSLDFLSQSPAVLPKSTVFLRLQGQRRCDQYFTRFGHSLISTSRHTRRHKDISVYRLGHREISKSLFPYQHLAHGAASIYTNVSSVLSDIKPLLAVTVPNKSGGASTTNNGVIFERLGPASLESDLRSIGALLDLGDAATTIDGVVDSRVLESAPVLIFVELSHVDVEELSFLAPVPVEALLPFRRLALVVTPFKTGVA
eukprot:Tbor_TRINITY_DN2878_c0_g1::TRINITY_DN2878_c0_g1_i1::g.23236::m.23236/K14399/CLP1, HERB; polyribonucleotide 5'-hydroxyl-kinase